MKEESDKIIKIIKEDSDKKLKEKDKEIEKIKEDSNRKLKEKEEIRKEKKEQIKQLENNYFDRARLSEEIKTKN